MLGSVAEEHTLDRGAVVVDELQLQDVTSLLSRSEVALLSKTGLDHPVSRESVNGLDRHVARRVDSFLFGDGQLLHHGLCRLLSLGRGAHSLLLDGIGVGSEVNSGSSSLRNSEGLLSLGVLDGLGKINRGSDLCLNLIDDDLEAVLDNEDGLALDGSLLEGVDLDDVVYLGLLGEFLIQTVGQEAPDGGGAVAEGHLTSDLVLHFRSIEDLHLKGLQNQVLATMQLLGFEILHFVDSVQSKMARCFSRDLR
mmetsp:Transcript_12810/g.19844  ORF Transcript_12810/g.19844 Transcript_12810/m.19844 type:complete len:252 (+) Transcript_12810:1290-2045(+)